MPRLAASGGVKTLLCRSLNSYETGAFAGGNRKVYLFSMDTQEFLWDFTVAPAAQLSSEVALETRVCTTNLSTSAI